MRRLSLLFWTAAVAAPALADWPADPNVNVPVGDRMGAQSVVKIAPASDGGCWIGWFDNASGSYAVYVQKLDYHGNEVFPHNGLLVSAHPQATSLNDWDLASDGAGGYVLAFTDTRDGADRDVFAYRVGANGAMLWGPDGVTISSNINMDVDPRITRASDGQFVVVYPRLTQAGGDPPGLIMQRLDAAGNKQFGPDGIMLLTAAPPDEQPAFVEMAPADDGSVILVWIRDTRVFQSPRHVIAQKFHANGTPMWNAVQPVVLSVNSVPIAHRPRLVDDDLGSGAIFAWHDSSQGVSNCFIQHVLGSGTVLFGGGPLALTVGTGMQHFDPALALDRLTGAVNVFIRQTNPSQTQSALVLQRVTFGGLRVFGNTGALLLPATADGLGNLRAVPAAPGPMPSGQGAILAYTRNFFGSANSAVYATRVSDAGAQVWGPHRLLSPTTGSRFRLGAAAAANGMVRVAWEGDTRNDPSGDVYAQNVSPGGDLGACPGDGNFDRTVNFADLNNVLSQFGQGGLFLSGDVNGDGVVNFADLNLVLSNFSLVCP